MFPTLQVSVSGFGVSLDPAVLKYAQHLLSQLTAVATTLATTPGLSTDTPGDTELTRGGGGGGKQQQRRQPSPAAGGGSVASLPYTFTPTTSLTEESVSVVTPVESRLVAAVKMYAVKVRLWGEKERSLRVKLIVFRWILSQSWSCFQPLNRQHQTPPVSTCWRDFLSSPTYQLLSPPLLFLLPSPPHLVWS